MDRMRRFLILVSLLTVGSANAEVRLQSAIDISKLLTEDREVLGVPEHFVFQMAFSRNEKLLAIATGGHRPTGREPTTHILVLDVTEGKTRFEKTIPMSYVSRIEWSSDDRKLLVQSGNGSWIVALEGEGEDCHAREYSANMGGFVGADSFVIVRRNGNSALLGVFDKRCKRIDEVTIPGPVSAVDTADHLIAFAGDGDIRILSGPDWKSFSRIFSPGCCLSPKFLNDGKHICAGRTPGASDENTFRCWELNEATPKLISSWPAKKTGTEVASATIRSTLALFLDKTYSYNPFTERERTDLKRWVIWDAMRGMIVGELPAKLQIRRSGMDSRRDTHLPWASAMSPRGSLLALGGDGKVEIYTSGSVPVALLPAFRAKQRGSVF